MFMYGSNLNLPLLSFRHVSAKMRNAVHIRMLNPDSYKGPRESVIGFRLRHEENFHVSDVDETKVASWIKEKNLKGLVRQEARRVIEQYINLKKWFPQTESYELESNIVEIGTSWENIHFGVWVILTVRFSEALPFDEFKGKFWDFVRENLTERGLSGRIVGMIKRLITKNFPKASVTVTTGWGGYEFFFDDNSSHDENLNMIVEVYIELRRPLPEEAVELLLNSTDERDFVIKFLMLIDPSNVSRVIVADPTMRSSDLKEVNNLLLRILPLTPS